MAFKSVKQYNEERYGGFFILRDDGDSADVIFLYKTVDDALIADTHYIKSHNYSGYVHCIGDGCPACNKGIRVQTKLFIPLYNINDGEIQFWDRSGRFESQLSRDVLSRYPNPSEYVFRITRHGAAGSMDTTYEIRPIARNSSMPFDKICAANKVSFPDHYDTVCKEFRATELFDMVNAVNENNGSYAANMDMPDYQVSPRRASGVSNTPTVDSLDVPDASSEVSDVDEAFPAYTNDVMDNNIPSEDIPSLDDFRSDEFGEDDTDDNGYGDDPIF